MHKHLPGHTGAVENRDLRRLIVIVAYIQPQCHKNNEIIGHFLRPHFYYLADSNMHYTFLEKSLFQTMVSLSDICPPLAAIDGSKSLTVDFSVNVVCSSIFTISESV